MTNRKTITVTVTQTGSISAEAHGPGPKCTDELTAIQALLPGATIIDSRLTHAYYQQNETNHAHQYEKEENSVES